MRILKYIFLLLLLVFIAASVFVATQKGEFDITQSKVINSPKTVVFNYVLDYTNWQDWFLNGEVDYKFPGTTAGVGSSLVWDGSESDGKIKTTFIKLNDSIAQAMEWNGLPAEVYWTFRETGGKTKVTWRVKGKMGFMPKIYAVMKGGAEKVMGTIYENSLAKLDKTLDYELNTYKIKPEGVVTLPGTYYLKQEITSTIANMPNNMRIMMSKLLYFFKKNDIAMSGKPFVIYDSFDTSKGITRFSVCIPVRDEIYTAPGSDIGYGQTTTVRAVKTTLQGDYSHLREAWAKSNSFIKDNKLAASGNGQIERYVFSREDSKSPSKWITEIYIPVDEPAPAKPDVSPQRAVVNQLEEDVHNQEISIP